MWWEVPVVNGGGQDIAWAPVWAQIDADFDDHLEKIRNFLRCPTVSASDDDMLAGAEFVAALIEGAGGTTELVPTPGHPAVLGHMEGDGPRLLRYGMYDVQPADEPGWSSPPFAAVTADVPGAGASIVARGAANSKGSLAAFLLALASARRVSDLPVEIVFLVDGEEELGSPSLPGVMSERRADLAAEAAFDMDLTADRRDVLGGLPRLQGHRVFCFEMFWWHLGRASRNGAPLERRCGYLLPRLVPDACPDRPEGRRRLELPRRSRANVGASG